MALLSLRFTQVAAYMISIVLSATTLATQGRCQSRPVDKQKSGRSVCSNVVALTGNVNINCSSLSEAEKKNIDSIPSILRKILANQLPTDEVLKKLDELEKEIAQRAIPPITVHCGQNSGNCAGINNGQQVTNQYETPRRMIHSDLVDHLKPVLESNHGRVSIFSNTQGDDLANQLSQIFKDAGWLPVITGTRMGQPFPDGVQLKWGGQPEIVNLTEQHIPDERPDVQELFRALRDSGIKAISGGAIPAMSDHQIEIDIGANPQ